MSAAPFPPDSIPPEVASLCRRLGQAGHAAYVVGGAVRDLLRSPTQVTAKDFDVATSALPEEVVRIFSAKRTIPTGIAHGTVTVLCETSSGDGKPRHVEVTTFRGETGYSDGRRPDRVEFITDLWKPAVVLGRGIRLSRQRRVVGTECSADGGLRRL